MTIPGKRQALGDLLALGAAVAFALGLLAFIGVSFASRWWL